MAEAPEVKQVVMDLIIQSQGVEKKIDELSKKMDVLNTKPKNVSNNFNSGFKAMKAAISAAAVEITAIIGAITLITNATKAMREEFNDDRKSLNSLNDSLRANGNYSKDASKSLDEYASAMQRQTGIMDETIRGGQAYIENMTGVSTETLKNTVPAINKLAYAVGGGPESAAEMFRAVGQAAGGGRNTLARYGIEVDSTASASDRLDSILRQINDKFADPNIDIYTKEQIKLTAAMGDFNGVAGKAIESSLVPIKDALSALLTEITPVTGATNSFAYSWFKFGNIFAGVIDYINWGAIGIRELSQQMKVIGEIRDLERLLTSAKRSGDAEMEGVVLQELLDKQREYQNLVDNSVMNQYGTENGVGVFDYIKQMSEAREREFLAALNNNNNYQPSPTPDDDTLNQSQENANATAQANKDAAEKTKEAWKEVRSEILSTADEIYSSLYDMYADDLDAQISALEAAQEAEQSALDAKYETATDDTDEKIAQYERDLAYAQAINDKKTASEKQALIDQLKAEREKEAEQEALDAKYDAALDAAKKKKFEADKTNSIVDVLFSTAKGIMQVWAQYAGTPAAAAVLTALVAAASAAQIASISSQKYTGYASGGLVGGSGSGDTVPAMLTPGEFVLSKPAVGSIGVDRLNQINSGNTTSTSLRIQNLNVYANDARALVKQLQDQRFLHGGTVA